MKTVLIATVYLTAAISAYAGDCNSGSGEILKLTEWSASARNERATDVSFTLENVSKRAVQMVNGTVWFEDALGQGIGGISITPDVVVAPGETIDQKSFMAGFDRLTKARKQDIQAFSCVDAVLYEDGTKEEFK
ncbi:hypothetical protein [Shinella oryzae]|uniref:Uncharacterized protein n=1 Tax=Shinella oryzae TaxID=2871820 RepID=A0ABY9K1A9_9HYPH|nr:hypothetical protein [Shinella oryzae]WLS01749.1 hypothetical protein Q9315_09840 [Shinella oryzae]